MRWAGVEGWGVPPASFKNSTTASHLSFYVETLILKIKRKKTILISVLFKAFFCFIPRAMLYFWNKSLFNVFSSKYKMRQKYVSGKCVDGRSRGAQVARGSSLHSNTRLLRALAEQKCSAILVQNYPEACCSVVEWQQSERAELQYLVEHYCRLYYSRTSILLSTC